MIDCAGKGLEIVLVVDQPWAAASASSTNVRTLDGRAVSSDAETRLVP